MYYHAYHSIPLYPLLQHLCLWQSIFAKTNKIFSIYVLWRRAKFPELESLVHHPMDYARVIQKIGNEMDMTLIDLEDILPQVLLTIMVLPVHCHFLLNAALS